MNEYKFEDLKIGMRERFEALITEEQMQMFKKISGDINPLHCDEAFAKSKGYKGKVAYGMLTSSLYSTLAGVYLPGKFSLIHSVNIKFLSPVFAGDKLRVEGEIVEMHDKFNMIIIKANIKNEAGGGKKVSRAELQVGILEDKK